MENFTAIRDGIYILLGILNVAHTAVRLYRDIQRNPRRATSKKDEEAPRKELDR